MLDDAGDQDECDLSDRCVDANVNNGASLPIVEVEYDDTW